MKQRRIEKLAHLVGNGGVAGAVVNGAQEDKGGAERPFQIRIFGF